MKNLSPLFAVFLLGLTLFTGCKKDNIVNNSAVLIFPKGVTTNISAALIDTLKKAGMTIYSGTTPPIVNGNYAMKSDSAIYAGGMKINDTEKFGDPLIFNFDAQNTADESLSLQFKDSLDPSFSGGALSKTYISGSGNNFTIFSAATNLSGYGASATFVFAISGTLTATGINNFQYCSYLLSKTDGQNSAVDTPIGYLSIDEEAHPFFTPKVSSF